MLPGSCQRDGLNSDFPAGVSTGRDGRGPYVLLDAAKVIANSKLNNVELVIDRDHAADLLPPGQERRAAGWIKQLVEKDGAIFAPGRMDTSRQGRFRGQGVSLHLPDLQLRYRHP